MLNLNELLRNVEEAKVQLAKLMESYEIQYWQIRNLSDPLDSIRDAVAAEIGRKAAVNNGIGNAYKVFLRIIKGIGNNRPAQKGAFYTKQDHFLSVCDGYHAIRMFRDDFNPPMVPENLKPIDLDQIYKGIDKTMDTRQCIPLPSAQELRAFAKMETAARRAVVSKRYDTWVPRFAIQHNTEFGSNMIRCFNANLLCDIMEAIPDAKAYAAATDGPHGLLYCRGTDGDAVLLPISMDDEEKRKDLAKSEALMDGSYFTRSAQKNGVA